MPINTLVQQSVNTVPFTTPRSSSSVPQYVAASSEARYFAVDFFDAEAKGLGGNALLGTFKMAFIAS